MSVELPREPAVTIEAQCDNFYTRASRLRKIGELRYRSGNAVQTADEHDLQPRINTDKDGDTNFTNYLEPGLSKQLENFDASANTAVGDAKAGIA
jgi:hypothetical protein